MTSNFERIRYPDGQIGAKYVGSTPRVDMGVDIRVSGPFNIEERINSYEDLFYIRSIADVIKHSGRGTSNYRLFIPCLFGQRSDRRFDDLQSFDLKLIAEVINSCGFGNIEILDPHSDVALCLINNSRKRSSLEYVEKAIKHYHDVNAALHNGSEDPILVSPDAGAYKKVFEYGEKLKLEVVAAVKHRDKEGNVDLRFIGDVKNKPCFIVDDLCDGGYTFLVLAKALREQGAREVYLYVSHGIFSKGFKELHKVIDHIYCTNSVKDIDVAAIEGSIVQSSVEKFVQIVPNDYVTQFKVI